MKSFNFLLIGVGGQGTILASIIVAEVGLYTGYEVKKAEVHGMPQRGGSIVSHIRWGQVVYSPLIGEGEVDMLISFEKLETLRYISWLRSNGSVLINNYRIIPLTVSTSEIPYPDDHIITSSLLANSEQIHWINGLEIAEECGNAKVANTVMLGALSALLKMDVDNWLKVIERYVPPKTLEVNRQAFQAGRQLL
jgi:indolepyruvate ferredoxin oxidoreductase beta subunit